MASIEFAGFVYDGAGTAVSGATINLYDRNTTTPVRATTTTNASGYWTITHATEGRFDVEIVNGTTTRRIKYDSALQLQEIETANLLVRNPGNTFKYDIVPGAITADRQLNLPVITGTDTLAVLGLAQTFTAAKIFNDSVALTFGTGSDATLQYDGTNLLYNSLVVGTGYHGFTGDISIANGYGLFVGHTAQVTFGAAWEIQAVGTGSADSAVGVARFSADADGSFIVLAKSRHATIGSNTIVVDDDTIGSVRAYASDGSDMSTVVADIIFEVDDGSPAASDIGGAFVVRTAPGGGSPDGVREVARWAATGDYTQTVGNMIALAGVRIGANSGDNEIDDASQGAASTTLYIGNAAITVASDERLKSNIVPFDGDALALIDQLTPVEFDQHSNRPFGTTEHYMNLTAQNVYKVAPWAVNTQGGSVCDACMNARPCDQHKPWAVNFDLLSGLFVRAIQQLRRAA